VLKDRAFHDLVMGVLQMNEDAKRMASLFQEYTKEELVEAEMLPVMEVYQELFMIFLEENEASLEELVGRKAADEFIRNVYTVREAMAFVISNPVS